MRAMIIGLRTRDDGRVTPYSIATHQVVVVGTNYVQCWTESLRTCIVSHSTIAPPLTPLSVDTLCTTAARASSPPTFSHCRWDSLFDPVSSWLIMQQSFDAEAGSSSKRAQHPAWLQHEINKAQLRKQQAEQYEEQQEQKQQRVTQQARTTRDRIRNPLAPPPPLPQQHTITFIDNHRPATCTPGRPQSERKEKSRPKWAMTAAEEEKEMETECDELVGFVEELDYQQWMDEMEERGTQRAAEEKENAETEEAQEKAATEETLGYEPQLETSGEWDEDLPRPPTGMRSSTQSTRPRPHTSINRPSTARPATSPQSATDNTETLVATLLHSSTAIRNIHSSHSLRALISSAQHSRPQQHAITTAPANSVSVAIPAPLVSVVATRDTIHGKINPSQLPYLHRHPAV